MQKEIKNFFDGIEIGTVSVKWCRIDSNGIVDHKILRHEGNPKEKLKFLTEGKINKNSFGIITGHFTRHLFDGEYRSESESIEKVLEKLSLKPDIVLSLGGESFVLYTIKNGLIRNILSSSKCAAGTGEFIIQQFKRMKFNLEEGLLAAQKGKKVDLATRCSVHCKSDATHKLNKGECTPEDIAHSLIVDMASKISKLVELSRWPSKEILVTGGLSLNIPFIEAFKTIMNDSSIITIPESNYIEAYGAALLAKDLFSETAQLNNYQLKKGENIHLKRLDDLKTAEPLLDYRVEDKKLNNICFENEYILGVDAGSTTTKAVLFNSALKRVDSSCYLRTNGNPIEATIECLKALNHETTENIKIIDIAVTGSGREVVSVFLNNCKTFNEILAHARGAIEELPEVDTVFEIGGQDSKYVYMLNGIPVDYIMNEGCSAGTGSFLEESAAIDMQVPFTQISKIALKSDSPISFGERCAAFINTDLRNALQQGAQKEDVLAGLVYSIADNYISRLVNARQIGETIFFQGGVALNKAVALAMAKRTGKKVVVPKNPELMGCIGAALMALDLISKNQNYNYCSLDDLLQNQMTIKGTFTCNSCENKCEIKKIDINNTIYPFGGLCSKFDNLRHNKKENEKGVDLIQLRNDLMFNKFGPKEIKNSKGTIGIPLALTAYELYPFYCKLINELGFDVVDSLPLREGNTKNLAPICYPCELVHGAVYGLMKKEVDYILLPNIISHTKNSGFVNSYMCPTTSIIPDIIKSTFNTVKDKILSPHITLIESGNKVDETEIIRITKKINITIDKAVSVFQKAVKYYNSFKRECDKHYNEIIARKPINPVIIFAGRPYTVFANNVNLSIPQKISSMGYDIIPIEAIPFTGRKSHKENSWNYTQQLMNAVHFSKEHSNYYLCFLSCFSCGPDANIYHEIKKELDGKAFCFLEIDSHTAHAGIETRLEAFLEIINMKTKL